MPEARLARTRALYPSPAVVVAERSIISDAEVEALRCDVHAAIDRIGWMRPGFDPALEKIRASQAIEDLRRSLTARGEGWPR